MDSPLHNTIKTQRISFLHPYLQHRYNHINSGLYHYAGNNPVKYVDPDGREINLSGLGKNNSHIFLQKVNIYSYQQFTLDKNNKIQVDSNNVNENGSLIFGNDLIEAIESEIKIDVFLQKI